MLKKEGIIIDFLGPVSVSLFGVSGHGTLVQHIAIGLTLQSEGQIHIIL